MAAISNSSITKCTVNDLCHVYGSPLVMYRLVGNSNTTCGCIAGVPAPHTLWAGCGYNLEHEQIFSAVFLYCDAVYEHQSESTSMLDHTFYSVY